MLYHLLLLLLSRIYLLPLFCRLLSSRLVPIGMLPLLLPLSSNLFLLLLYCRILPRLSCCRLLLRICLFLLLLVYFLMSLHLYLLIYYLLHWFCFHSFCVAYCPYPRLNMCKYYLYLLFRFPKIFPNLFPYRYSSSISHCLPRLFRLCCLSYKPTVFPMTYFPAMYCHLLLVLSRIRHLRLSYHRRLYPLIQIGRLCQVRLRPHYFRKALP